MRGPCLTLCLAIVLTIVLTAYDKGQGHGRQAAAAGTAGLVDINRASANELQTLPGIGAAEAKKIVAARPYMTKTALVEKQVLTLAAYDALRSRIVVVHTRAAARPKT
jgi:DNA uptake protein ComE-like DNA-binding protein